MTAPTVTAIGTITDFTFFLVLSSPLHELTLLHRFLFPSVLAFSRKKKF